MSRIISLAIAVAIPIAAYSQEKEKPKDPVSLVLISQDLSDATRLMTVYDLDEDGFVDEGEMKRLRWRDELTNYDFNQDEKLSHLEMAVHQAKLRDDVGISALDVNSAKTKLRRYDKNKNGQIDPLEIQRGWPNGLPDDYDANKDGIVTLGELTHHFAFARGLRRATGIEGVDHSSAGRLLAKFDVNKDGKLEAGEAAKTYLPMRLADFDEDSDDMLTIVELETMLSKRRRDLGLTRTDQQDVNKLFGSFDRNSDGRIAEKEMQSPFLGANAKQLEQYDGDKDGIVTRSEVEIMFSQQRQEKGYIEEDYSKSHAMFRRHDTNRSQSLEMAELFLTPEAGQLPSTLMDRADLNMDRKISKIELAKHYAKQRKASQ